MQTNLGVWGLMGALCFMTACSEDEGPNTVVDPPECTMETGGTLATQPETYSYIEGGGERQALDFYQISGVTGPRPVLVWVHGGAWIAGDKSSIPSFARQLAQSAGFHLASVGYRLATDAPWPAQMHDINAGIRWLKGQTTELNLNPDAFVISGESAGAHLAAVIATASDVDALAGSDNPGFNTDVMAAVLFYGVYSMRTLGEHAQANVTDGTCTEVPNATPVWLLLGCGPESTVQDPLAGCDSTVVDQASPVFHVDATDPPVWMAHGQTDCVVPWKQTEDLEAALTDANVPHTMSLTASAGHNIDALDDTVEEVRTFVGTACAP